MRAAASRSQRRSSLETVSQARSISSADTSMADLFRVMPSKALA